MQLPHKELRAFAQLMKSCVFPRSRKSVATFPTTLCSRSSFAGSSVDPMLCGRPLGNGKVVRDGGQSFWLNFLLYCLAVLCPFHVEMFGVSVSSPVQWNGYYTFGLCSLQLCKRSCQQKAWLRKVSSDDMALIAEH